MIHDIHTVLHTPQGCCNSKYQDDKKEDIFGLNVICYIHVIYVTDRKVGQVYIST